MQHLLIELALLAWALLALGGAEARSLAPGADDAAVSGVIPSPNQDFGDGLELQRTRAPLRPALRAEHAAQSSGEAAVPIYVSPFARAERRAAPGAALFDERQESSHAPPNYAPKPSPSDLKTSASYGHGHHHGHQSHHHGYDHSGWLDMGAWTGGKGSFGWYADYPVGSKHHGYHGRK